MKRDIVVLTGACGFIGSAVSTHLNELGYTRLLLVDDIGETGKWKNIQGRLLEDFISKHALLQWLDLHHGEVFAIIHLGACANTMERNGNYLMENNFRYTQNLAKIATSKGIRFIYASSAATYGNGSLGFSDDPDQIELLRPLNLYGFSKHLFDVWAKQRGILDQIVGLKYFNVFGPNEDHKGAMASMVYKMFPRAYQEGVITLFKSSEPTLYADGGQMRDFIYVKDVARVTCDFLYADIRGIFNIGRGEPTTWNALAAALFAAVGVKGKIEYVEMPKELTKQYQNYTCADMARYKQAYGLGKEEPVCRYDIEQGVFDYVQKHLIKGEGQ